MSTSEPAAAESIYNGLVETLQKLEDCGAPIHASSSPATDVEGEYLIEVKLYVGPEKTFYWTEFDFWESDGPNPPDVWTLNGWCAHVLELKGLRREVEILWSFNDPMGVIVKAFSPSKDVYVASEIAPTELEAHLALLAAVYEREEAA